MGSRIIVTGGTRGLGLETLRRLLLQSPASLPPPYHLILLARNPEDEQTKSARRQLEALAAANTTTTTITAAADHTCSDVRIPSVVQVRKMDLACLASVRDGAALLLEELLLEHGDDLDPFKLISPGRIDVLLLNAAVAKASRQFVIDQLPIGEEEEEDDDGVEESISDCIAAGQRRYEETACVNHVAHQLLIALLSPILLHPTPLPSPSPSSSSPKPKPNNPRLNVPRIVFTSSALHRRLADVKELERYFDPSKSSPQPHLSLTTTTTTTTNQQASSSNSNSPKSNNSEWSLLGSYSASKFLQMVGIQRLISHLRSLPDFASSSSSPTPTTPTTTATKTKCRVEIVVVQPGYVPSTSLSRESSTLERVATRWILPLLSPLLSFVASLGEGGEMILQACTRHVEELPIEGGEDLSASTSTTTSTTTTSSTTVLRGWDGNVESGVRTCLLLRGKKIVDSYGRGVRSSPDPRTHDPHLTRTWWPMVVQRAWQRSERTKEREVS